VAIGRLCFFESQAPNTPDGLLRMKAASGRTARILLVSQPDQFLIKSSQ
jgi:hypothetical protein